MGEVWEFKETCFTGVQKIGWEKKKRSYDHLLYSTLTMFACPVTTYMCGLVLSHANCVVVVAANSANKQLCFLLVTRAKQNLGQLGKVEANATFPPTIVGSGS